MAVVPDMTIAVSVPLPESETSSARGALTSAENVTIANADDYEMVASTLKEVKLRYKRLDDARRDLKRPIDEAGRRVQAFFAPALDALTKAENVLKRKLAAYSTEQDRLRREAQANAQAVADKQRAKLLEQSRKASERGDTAKAATLEERADTIVVPVFAPSTPKVSGVTMSEVWLYEITDEALIPRHLCSPDPKKIRQLVDALKGETRIEGVRVYRDTRVASRSA